MVIDPKLLAIRRSVTGLVASAEELAGRLDRAQQILVEHPDTLAALQPFRPMVDTQGQQLATYLAASGGAGPSGEASSRLPGSGEATAPAEVLQDLSLAFHHCALGYGMLYEVALRLYEPRLREIASEHLKHCAEAALATAQLLPGVVARQLAQVGLHCTCTCPMCGIGACACVSLGTDYLIDSLRGAAPSETEPPGFVLLPPNGLSELARAGLQGGERVLAVDGQRVRGRTEFQAALRKRKLGDNVRLLVQSGSTSPRELSVRHAGDYPNQDQQA